MAQKNAVSVVERRNELQEIFTTNHEALIEVMPQEMRADVDRMARLCIRKYASDPDLIQCSPRSFFSAVIDAVQSNLDPSSPLGLAWLIPRWNKNTRQKEVQFQIGYKGLLALARRYGMVRTCRANVVCRGEPFTADFAAGTIQHLFEPGIDRSDEELFVAAYAVAVLPDGSTTFDLMTREEVMEVKKAGATKEGGIWARWPSRMWRKSAIIRLFNGGTIELAPGFADVLAREFEDPDERPNVIQVEEVPKVAQRGVDGLLDALTDDEVPASEPAADG